MTATRPAHPAVDEMLRIRHEPPATSDIESPSRAAGGFPTLGGGMRGRCRTEMAGRVVAAVRGVATSEGGA